MTVSPYFNHSRNRSEQDLYEDMVIESIQMSGMDVYYLPRTIEALDPILGESIRSVFNDVVKVEVYAPDAGNTGGEGELMAKFGYVQRDSLELIMAKRRFENQIKRAGLDLLRPREGDLIYIGDLDQPYASQMNQLFEITYVNFHEAQWSFGKTFAYKLNITSYEASHERFETASPLDAVVVDVTGDMEGAINTAVQETKQTLLKFDARNPLANI